MLTMPKLIVSKHRQSIWVWLGIVSVVVEEPDSVLVHSRYHFFWVIPGTILVRCEIHWKFRLNYWINLAGPSAKFDSCGIPGIAQILPDSGWNQWRTVKTLMPGSFTVSRHTGGEHSDFAQSSLMMLVKMISTRLTSLRL